MGFRFMNIWIYFFGLLIVCPDDFKITSVVGTPPQNSVLKSGCSIFLLVEKVSPNTPPKINQRPLKRAIFKRKVESLPTIIFKRTC